MIKRPLNRQREDQAGDTNPLTGSILDKIMRADNLTSLPSVAAIQVYQMIRQENVSVKQIAKTLERDPALTAKILKMVNSALFALPNKIASLPQAIVILGLRTVKVMSLFAIVNKLGEDIEGKFDYAKYWERSLTTAVSSRLLAEKYDQAAGDEAFVAGLLADLGILASIQCALEEYRPIVKEYEETNMPPQVVEGKRLGLTHAHVGSALLLAWGLPDEIAHAAEHHHDPSAPPLGEDEYHLAPLVWAAARISDLFCRKTVGAEELDELIQTLCRELNAALAERAGEINPEEIEGILEQIDLLVQSMAEQISVNIGETTSYDELRMTAMVQLADLSVSAELDRAVASRMADAAQHEVEALSSEKKKLAQEAMTDALTQLANRRAFDERISQTLDDCTKSGETIGLIMLDLDSFKRVNDTYGHLFGDEVLKVVGRTLKKVEVGSHFVARYGGEEFAIICTKSTLKELKDLAEMVRRETERIKVKYGTRTIKITASLGAAQVDLKQTEIGVEELIEKADRALLKAKRAGGNVSKVARKNE